MINEKKPFFSVIIPLYNKQSHVKETLDSVFIQTFQDFEIVIINDGSTDDSVKIVEAINDNRIRIINQENQGVSVARNNGIKEAKADFIAFLDADDLWLPEFLKTIYDLIEKFPEAGIFATKFEKCDNNNNRISRTIRGLPRKKYEGIIPNFFKSAVLSEYPVWTSSICIPKRIFFENNIWFPIGEKYAEDQHVWSRVAMIYKVAYNTKVCALYMIDSENNTIGKSSQVKKPYKSILSLNNYRHLIKSKDELKFFDLYIKKWIYTIILLNIKNGYRINALDNFFKYNLTFKYRLKLIVLFIIPSTFHPFLNGIFKTIKKVIRK